MIKNETRVATTAKEATMADVLFNPGSFSDTSVTVQAVSKSGIALFEQMFGAAAVEATMPKNRGFDFIEFCENKGLTVG